MNDRTDFDRTDFEAADFDIVPPDFDAMYASDPDPWGVQTQWYERRKLDVLLASLPRRRYASAWEPGCGPGVVSEALSRRVDQLTASDCSAVALALARRRCASLTNVAFHESSLPAVAVAQPVDLVVVAEFLYYVPGLCESLAALWSAARPGAQVVFVHWAHQPEDAFRGGPAMHADIAADAVERDARRLVSHVDQDFVLDIYEAAR